MAIPLAASAQGKDAAKKPPADKAAADKSAEKKSEAGVNWSGQVIKATGSGAPDMKASSPAQARLGAEMAAKMDAFRNLLSQVKGIQVSGGKTVGDAMAADELRGKVEGVIRGYKVTGKRYFSDNGVEMDVEVPLAALTEAVVPQSTGADSGKLACTDKGEKKNTGLIVDARGLDVTPALSPRILDESGNTLYAADCVKDDAKKSSGVAGYTENLDNAKKDMRVGDKPLVLKAKAINGSDVVLSAEDVKKLGEGNNSYLAEGRVVIVTK
ncbi:MAG: LPP20 family lipoprotein [Myxococcaceae bacterium]